MPGGPAEPPTAQAAPGAADPGSDELQPGAASDVAAADPATTEEASPASEQTLPTPTGEWSVEELAAVRDELRSQAAHLRGEIGAAESAAAALQRAGAGESSGDEADAGAKTFEREHEMSLANNSRGLLTQVERALARIDAGTYGHCESCGDSISKARLQAFPRATLCVRCKQREERR